MNPDGNLAWSEIQQRTDIIEQCFLRLLSPEAESSYWADFQDFKRELHTLKGVCGLSGLSEAAQKIHSIESLAEESSEHFRPAALSSTLEEPLRKLLQTLRETPYDADNSPDDDRASRHDETGETKNSDIDDVFPGTITADQTKQLKALAEEGTSVFHLCYDQKKSPKSLRELRNELETCTRILVAAPKVEDNHIHFHFLVAETPRLSEISAAFDLRVQPYAGDIPAAQNSERRTAAKIPSAIQATDRPKVTEIRLESSKIEGLHRQCSDLMVRFGRMKERNRLCGEQWENFEGVLLGLQETILSTRLVRLETLLSRFPLEIRNVAQKLGKSVKLELPGESLELDRDIVQGLAEPLRHLLINAVVHGVETPETRRKIGKPDEGVITLNATMSGSFLRIEITDDGRGIDREALSSSCGRKLNSSQAVLEQICRPGWSSRAKSDVTSGRGLGMDIVQKSLTRLRGSVELNSELGSGTQFVLTLPASLTTLSVLEIEFGNTTLAFARDSINQVIDLEETILGRTPGQEICDLNGTPVPLFDVAEHLNLEGSPSLRKSGLVCRGLTGLVVLRVPVPAGIRDVVLQPCDSPFLARDWLDGVTTLGSGKTAFLVSISGFVERARNVV